MFYVAVFWLLEKDFLRFSDLETRGGAINLLAHGAAISGYGSARRTSCRPRSKTKHCLRRRTHPYELPQKGTRNFIQGMLCDDIYCKGDRCSLLGM